MPTTVAMPDGRRIEFPAGMSLDDITKVIESDFAPTGRILEAIVQKMIDDGIPEEAIGAYIKKVTSMPPAPAEPSFKPSSPISTPENHNLDPLGAVVDDALDAKTNTAAKEPAKLNDVPDKPIVIKYGYILLTGIIMVFCGAFLLVVRMQ